MNIIKKYIKLRLQNNLRSSNIEELSTQRFNGVIAKEEYWAKSDEIMELHSEYSALRENLITKDNEHMFAYWKHVLDNNMIPEYILLYHLEISLKGFYFTSTDKYKGSLLDFINSKRPYGNKNIPLSIIANLGMDYLNMLEVTYNLPTEMEDFCYNLHNKLIEKLTKEDK